MEGTIATSADEACRAIRNCSNDEVPKIFLKDCSKKSELPTLNPLENFIRPYSYDVSNFAADSCLINQD